MNLRDMTDAYENEGLTTALAEARVCQDIVNNEKIFEIINLLIFNDREMYENSMDEVVNRISRTFHDEQYLKRVSGSRQRWLDNEIHEITDGILDYLKTL